MWELLLIIIVIILLTVLPQCSKTIVGARDNVIGSRFYYGHRNKKLMVNEGSLKWTTPEKTANVMKKIVDAFFGDHNDDIKMLNMTGNCGGDLFPFVDDHKYHGVVYEIDNRIYNVLRDNLLQFPGHERWQIKNGDSTLDTGKYDIVYCDPPFGAEYDGNNSIKKDWPTIGEYTMASLVNKFREYGNKTFLLKLPKKGFDSDGFLSSLKESPWYYKYYTPESLDTIGNLRPGTNKIVLIILSYI